MGKTFRVVGDVDALGIWDGDPEGKPAYVLLDIRPSVTGPEVKFTRPLMRGQTFRIVGARHRHHPLEDLYYYLVELTDDPQAPLLPVHLNLNDSTDIGNGELNPKTFEQVK